MMENNQEYWATRITEYQNSGESLRGWCEKTGIKRSSMRYWVERLEELSSDSCDVTFAKLAVAREVGERNEI